MKEKERERPTEFHIYKSMYVYYDIDINYMFMYTALEIHLPCDIWKTNRVHHYLSYDKLHRNFQELLFTLHHTHRHGRARARSFTIPHNSVCRRGLFLARDDSNASAIFVLSGKARRGGVRGEGRRVFGREGVGTLMALFVGR